MDDHTLGWVTGIIEAEGSFVLWRRTHGSLAVVMTDKDIIDRLADVTGIGVVGYVKPRQQHHKDAWRWRVRRHENVRDLLALIGGELSSRRRAQAQALPAVGELDSCSPRSNSLEFEMGWATGFFEGEGSVYRSPSGKIAITASSTDPENLTRLQAVLGGRIYDCKQRRAHWRTAQVWKVSRIDDALRLLSTLEPHLGQRRRESAARVRDAIESHAGRRTGVPVDGGQA